MNYYFNSKQWQNKLNKTNRTKKIKKRANYLATYLAQPTWQPTGRPSTVLARASHLLPLARQAERSAPAHAELATQLPGRLPRLDSVATPRSHSSALPRPLRHPILPLALSLVLSRYARAQPSPPLAAAATTAVPSSHDHAQQLRNRAPHPHAEGNNPEGSASSPSTRLQPRDTGDRHRRSVASEPSPSALSLPTTSP